MEYDIPPLQQQPPGENQPEPPPVTDKKMQLIASLKHLFRNKALLLGTGLFMIASMGVYIFVAPSQDIRTIAAIPFPPSPTVTAKPLTPAPTKLPPPPTSTPIPLPSETPTPTIPPGTLWKTYSNTKYGYSIKYSPDWVVKDLGELEPKIPSYLNFYPKTASASSRFITIASTTRTYDEQLTLGASMSAITVSGITGTKQSFQDSDGNKAIVVILPRKNDLLVLRAKTTYHIFFDLMLSTLSITTK